MIKFNYKNKENATTNTMKKFIIGLVAIILIIIGGTKVYASIYPVQSQGFTLAGAGSSIGDTTLTLSSFKQINGTSNLTMTQFGTIGFATVEPGNGTQEESITFTGITQNTNGSAVLTGINNVDFVYPFNLTTGLVRSHPGASTVVVSNTSYFYYRMLAFLDNALNITGYWTAPDPIQPQGIATKNYVDGVAFGGIGGATETATGTVQIATGVQIASSTTNGSVGRLAIPASLATSTCANTTNALRVVVTDNSGKIASNCIPGIVASSTNITTGIRILDIGKNIQVFTNTGTSTFSVPSGISKVYVRLVGGGGGGGGTGNDADYASGGGGGSSYSEKFVDVSATTSIQVFVGIGGPGGAINTAGSKGTWSTFGTNGFYLFATPGLGAVAATNSGGGQSAGGSSNSPASNGGDINITGGSGGPGFSSNNGLGLGLQGFGGTTLLCTYISQGYGCGGSGTVGANQVGADGAQGIVIVTW